MDEGPKVKWDGRDMCGGREGVDLNCPLSSLGHTGSSANSELYFDLARSLHTWDPDV